MRRSWSNWIRRRDPRADLNLLSAKNMQTLTRKHSWLIALLALFLFMFFAAGNALVLHASKAPVTQTVYGIVFKGLASVLVATMVVRMNLRSNPRSATSAALDTLAIAAAAIAADLVFGSGSYDLIALRGILLLVGLSLAAVIAHVLLNRMQIRWMGHRG